MPKSRTKPSKRKLSDLARHVVVPKGVVSTGWPSVEAKCRDLGITFRPWQPDVGRLILAKRADGKYASTIGGTGMSIPRQVGKTFLVGAIVFALCLLRPNLTVIWTAHRLRTAEETFKKMQAFAKRKRIAPHVRKIVLGSGEGAIEFHNGSRILFGARERGFGRGFDEVDVLIFDEGQNLTDNALDDMIPATNQSRQEAGALLLFMGTPPKPRDPSEVFTRMRTEALTGEDDDTGWVEFGADPGYQFTETPETLTEADWKQIEKANPSYPQDTPREAILRMRKKLGPESFVREGAGVWDEVSEGSAFGPGAWESIAHLEEEQPQVTAIGLAVTMDRLSASVAAVGGPPGAVRIGAIDSRPGTGWLVARAKQVQDEHGVDVVIDGKGPGADLIPALEAAGVRFTPTNADDFKDACALIFDQVQQKAVGHHAHQELDASVAGAVWKYVGDRRVLDRRRSSSDPSMLEGGLLALWAQLSEDESDPPPEIF